MSYTPAMFHGPVGARTGVTFFINGVPYHADASNPSFSALVDELRNESADADHLIALAKPAQAIIQAIAKAEAAPIDSVDYLPAGVVSVTTSEVRYNGEQVTGVLVDRILEMLADGFNIMPMVRFLENLYRNPAEYARDELYLWLENSNLPITEDGCFLAYKMVSDDYRSRNNFLNLPGTTVSMPRQACDPIRDHLCSTGLHFCSKQYIGEGHYGKIVVLKINPADVVSIPADYGNSKGRAWKYDILGDFGDDPFTKVWPSVVSTSGETFTTDPNLVPLEIGSDLAKALFAAGNEDGIRSRTARLSKASSVLGRTVGSYYDLTVGEATTVLEAIRAEKAQQDEAAAQAALQSAKRNRQVQIDTINSWGIIRLRREASAAGLAGAWKGTKADGLRFFLISKVK